METGKKMPWLWPLLAAMLGAALALLRNKGGTIKSELPVLTGFGRWLRALSLGSAGGNALAWAIVLALTALPLVWLFLLWRRRKWAGEDSLLLLLAGLIFVLCYFLVNPTLLAQPEIVSALGNPAASFFPLACLGTCLSVVVAWIAFRVLRRMEKAPADRLAAAARPMLIGCAALAAFGACWSQVSTFMERWAEAAAGNTEGGIGLTVLSLAVLTVLTLIPDLLAALTLLWGAELAGAMGSLDFAPETVELCKRTARGCRAVAMTTVQIAVGANLFQLLLLSSLRSSYFHVMIPVFPLVLSVAMYLLCRCLQRGQELQADSASII